MVTNESLFVDAPFSDLKTGAVLYSSGDIHNPRPLPDLENWIGCAGVLLVEHDGQLQTMYSVTPGFEAMPSEAKAAVIDFQADTLKPLQTPNSNDKAAVLEGNLFGKVALGSYPKAALVGGVSIHMADGTPQTGFFFNSRFGQLAGHPLRRGMYRETELTDLGRWARSILPDRPSGEDVTRAQFIDTGIKRNIALRLFTGAQLIEDLGFTEEAEIAAMTDEGGTLHYLPTPQPLPQENPGKIAVTA